MDTVRVDVDIALFDDDMIARAMHRYTGQFLSLIHIQMCLRDRAVPCASWRTRRGIATPRPTPSADRSRSSPSWRTRTATGTGPASFTG